MNGFEKRALAAAAAANERIERCHEQVACPTCGAPVGERCWPVRRNMDIRPLKHPHRARWVQVQAPR